MGNQLGPALALLRETSPLKDAKKLTKILSHFIDAVPKSGDLSKSQDRIEPVLAVLYAIVVRHPPERLPLGWLGAAAALSFVLFYGERWPAEQALHRFAAFFDILRPFCT